MIGNLPFVDSGRLASNRVYRCVCSCCFLSVVRRCADCATLVEIVFGEEVVNLTKVDEGSVIVQQKRGLHFSRKGALLFFLL